MESKAVFFFCGSSGCSEGPSINECTDVVFFPSTAGEQELLTNHGTVNDFPKS